MRDTVPERRRLKRVRVFRHVAILWVLGFFDLLCWVTGKAPIGEGVFSVALVLYVIYLVS